MTRKYQSILPLAMRFQNRWIFLALLGFLNGELFAKHLEEPSDAFYEKGLEYKRSGNWIKAMGTWLAGQRLLEKRGNSDPRIAIAFIETATEQAATQYYELACDMYYWGMSPNRRFQYKKTIQQEIERIAPILEEEELAEWRRLLKQNHLLIFDRIEFFWKQKDPTPSTKRNERLLEHWERIAYVRDNFRKARNTAYRSDDRGVIYVKYGMPQRIINGMLGARRAALKSWTDIILDSSGDSRSAFGEGSFASEAVQQTVLLQEIDRFNNLPEYEIWFYQSLDSDHRIFFLFGNREGVGRFGLQSGVEALIPSSAFLLSNTGNTNGISPGAVLQSAYYSELMHLDPFFEDRFHDLERVWQSLNSQVRIPITQVNSTFRLKRQQYEILDTHDPVYAAAPREKSDFYETVSEVELVCYPFRHLDDQNRPKLALTIFTFPKFRRNLAKVSTRAILPEHFITNSIIVRDRQQREIRRLVDSRPPGAEYMSTIVLDHDPRPHDYVLSAEVFSQESSQVGFLQIGELEVFPEVIAVGRKEMVVSSPLAGSVTALELSDLIVGVTTPEESDSLQLHYPVVPSNRLLATDLLKAYLEVYHLDRGDDGMARFSFECEVGKLEGKKRMKKESLSVSFELSSSEPTSKEIFEMDISKLSAGSYELMVTVKDIGSGQQKERKAEFEIYNQDSRL